MLHHLLSSCSGSWRGEELLAGAHLQRLEGGNASWSPNFSFFPTGRGWSHQYFHGKSKKHLQSGVREGRWENSKKWRRERKEATSPACSCSCSPLGRSSPPSDLSTQLGLSQRLRESRQHWAACESSQTYAPPGNEASESWTEPTCQSGKTPSCVAWRGAGQPWGRILLFKNWTFMKNMEGKPTLFKTLLERQWSWAGGLARIHGLR